MLFTVPCWHWKTSYQFDGMVVSTCNMQVTNSVSSDRIKLEVIPNASQKESSAKCLIREVVSRLMIQAKTLGRARGQAPGTMTDDRS